ncbi:MAG: amidohydrolase [Hyphomicrobiales bacterium]|nr:amidohydrolase [Hyphomicrobiales bacterium]
MHRIDTHHHIVPPFYRQWLEKRGYDAGGMPIPQWTPQSALEFMESHAIETAIFSVSTPGAYVGDAVEAREMARRVNVETAEIVARDTRRFGFFATLCLPDVEASIAEAHHAFDDLKADGIVLMTNTDGVYMGDPSLEPLMQALNARGAVVFLHPGALPADLAPGVPAYVADFLLDTVRTAVSICKAGWLESYPNLRFILSHAGGFIPFAAYRIARACAPDGNVALGMQRLKRFYMDTAVAASPTSLPSLFAFADPSRILFGSDLPYANAVRAGAFTSMLDAFPMDERQRARIARENALTLFPRLQRS